MLTAHSLMLSFISPRHHRSPCLENSTDTVDWALPYQFTLKTNPQADQTQMLRHWDSPPRWVQDGSSWQLKLISKSRKTYPPWAAPFPDWAPGWHKIDNASRTPASFGHSWLPSDFNLELRAQITLFSFKWILPEYSVIAAGKELFPNRWHPNS